MQNINLKINNTEIKKIIIHTHANSIYERHDHYWETYRKLTNLFCPIYIFRLIIEKNYIERNNNWNWIIQNGKSQTEEMTTSIALSLNCNACYLDIL